MRSGHFAPTGASFLLLFIPAARREIIESRMTRGETVPYVKEVGLPGMRFLEVDINFSLDYKNSRDGILGSLFCRDSIDFHALYHCPVRCSLGNHQRYKAGSAPDIKNAATCIDVAPRTYQNTVGTDFHGTPVMPYGKLFEPEIGITHIIRDFS